MRETIVQPRTNMKKFNPRRMTIWEQFWLSPFRHLQLMNAIELRNYRRWIRRTHKEFFSEYSKPPESNRHNWLDEANRINNIRHGRN